MSFTKPTFGMLGTGGEFDPFSTPTPANSPNFTPGGTHIAIERTGLATSDDIDMPAVGISFSVDADNSAPVGQRFVTPGIYIQGKITGDDPLADGAFSCVNAFAWNDMVGDGDAVAVRGMARKSNRTGNLSDSAGVFGGAYQKSVESGGVMGLEGHIYQTATGNGPIDGVSSAGWSTALHLMSNSYGSPATAALMIGGGTGAGRYNFWNGINFTGVAFVHDEDGGGIEGTVGINMGAFSATYHPEIAWKLGYADGTDSWHLYTEDGISNHANFFSVENTGGTGATGYVAKANGVGTPYLDLYHNGTRRMSAFYEPSTSLAVVATPEDNDLVLRRNGLEKVRLKSDALVLFPSASVSLSEENSMAFELTDNSTVTVKVKGDDGLTRSGVIPLT